MDNTHHPLKTAFARWVGAQNRAGTLRFGTNNGNDAVMDMLEDILAFCFCIHQHRALQETIEQRDSLRRRLLAMEPNPGNHPHLPSGP